MYGVLSDCYDLFTQDVHYDKICNFICNNIQNRGILLDLCCGSGNLSFLLEKNGFDVIGVDGSLNMLSVALDKKGEDSNLLFLHQDAENLDLFGTVDGAVCVLDSVNHFKNPKQVFSRVSLFSNKDAIFIFDINTPFKFDNIISNNVFTYESDDSYLIWKNTHLGDKIKYTLDLFSKDESGLYSFKSENFFEYIYTDEYITECAKKSGFELLQVCDDYTQNAPKDNCLRKTFVFKKV